MTLTAGSAPAGTPAIRRTLAVIRGHWAAFMSIAVALFGQSVLVLTGAITARILGVDNRGYLALLAVIPIILSQVCTLGIPLAVTYQIAREPRSAYATIWKALKLSAVLAIFATILHVCILLVAFAHQSQAVRQAAYISVVATPGTMAYLMGLAVLQGQQRFRGFNALRLSQLMPYTIGLVALFLLGSQDLALVTLLWAGTTALSGLITLALALRPLRKADGAPGASVRWLISFGIKGLPGQMSIIETFRLDQLIVGSLVGSTALGLYVVGIAFCNLPRFVGQSIGMIAYPTLASSSTDQTRRMLGYFALTAAICVVLVAVLELFAGHLVTLFFGREFAGAVSVTRIILVGALFLGLRRVLSDCARGMGRPEDGTIAELIGFAIGLPALVLMSLRWGADGAAGAVVVTGAINLLIVSFLTIRAVSAERERPYERRSPMPSSRFQRFQGRSRVDSDPLTLARVLFYAGTASLGLLTVRPAAGFTLSDIFFMFSLVALVLALASRRVTRTTTLHPLIVFGALLYSCGGLASSLFSDPSASSIGVVIRFLFLTTVWLWLAAMVLVSASQVRTAACLWVFSVAASGAAAGIQLLAGDVIPGSSPVWGRMTGFTGQPNDLGGECAVAMIAGLTLFATAKGFRPRLALAGMTALTAVGLVLSGSVGGFMATAIAFGFMVVTMFSPSKALIVVAVVGIGLFAFVSIEGNNSETPTQRLQTVSSDNGSVSRR